MQYVHTSTACSEQQLKCFANAIAVNFSFDRGNFWQVAILQMRDRSRVCLVYHFTAVLAGRPLMMSLLQMYRHSAHRR